MSDMFEGIKRGLEEALAYEKGEIELKTSFRSNDLISREALASKAVYMHGFGENKYIPLKAVQTAPAIDAVEVVHAKWEYWAGGLAKCPNCGYEYTDYIECDSYCGNCGAQMDGE